VRTQDRPCLILDGLHEAFSFIKISLEGGIVRLVRIQLHEVDVVL
jgi:hypothetical protein